MRREMARQGSIRTRWPVATAVFVIAVWALSATLPSAKSAQSSQHSFGTLLRDPDRYAQLKAAANARADQKKPQPAKPPPPAPGPVAGPSWEGQFMANELLSPPDPTGAISPTRYVQLINLRYGIYDRTGALLSQGNLDTLTGYELFTFTDPQIIWDAATERFYYIVADREGNTLGWGFSKTSSPSTARDEWCRYRGDFGYPARADFPDYPKLGDTKDFLLVGVNAYDNRHGGLGPFVSSDVVWIRKPAAGAVSTCPNQDSFAAGVFEDLRQADGSPAYTPVPADQVDNIETGHVVANNEEGANFITVFDVTRNSATGAAEISGPRSLPVSPYSIPPDAPQKGTQKKLDTIDARFKHAVEAIDPRLGRPVVWSSHTVAGGAGAEERWYEIDPAGPTLFQSGAATSPSLYVYNGGISPDRAVSGTQSGFGSSMVMGFNTSSSQQFPAIHMVSKIGGGPQSPFVLVKQSPGKNVDFTCRALGGAQACRWGDYSGAVPDPAASLTGTTGRVWLSNEWNLASIDNLDTEWRTWNWAARP